MKLGDLLKQVLGEGVAIELDIHITVRSESAEYEFNEFTVQCTKCGWTRSYASQDSSRRGLRTHQSRHCTARDSQFPAWIKRELPPS